MIDMNRDMEGVVMYDPVTNPDGLISVAGAENDLMADHLQKYAKKFAKGYKMEKGRYFSFSMIQILSDFVSFGIWCSRWSGR